MRTIAPLRHARAMHEIPNAFSPKPLKGEEEMVKFYCETMPVRSGDEFTSPILNIQDACLTPMETCAFLLLGHTGCGKSTELNRMSDALRREGCPVCTVQCASDLDLINPVYEDLMLLMGSALLKIAGEIGEETGYIPGEDIRNTLADFWKPEGERVLTVEAGGSAAVEAGITARTPAPIAKLLELFVTVRSDLRFSAATRTEYRERIRRRSSEWMFALTRFTDEIADRLEGRRPVVIFEDLDKLDPDSAWKIFYEHAATLSGVPFPVVYTFPIALFYDSRFGRLDGYFNVERLPMIKQETVEGTPYPQGFAALREIVAQRADLSLFQEDALRMLIEKTGGSLRDLFRCIIACSRRARSAYRAGRRGEERIQEEDARLALNELKSTLTSRVDGQYYAFLADICNGNRARIQDHEKLLKMLEAGTVLEYNGRRWHNVHPLVAEFLKEQRLDRACEAQA